MLAFCVYIEVCKDVAIQWLQDGRYTRSVCVQQLDKHVFAATNPDATTEELCFLCGLC
jgi:uncharacterized CHY-type Zn-finger protein